MYKTFGEEKGLFLETVQCQMFCSMHNKVFVMHLPCEQGVYFIFTCSHWTWSFFFMHFASLHSAFLLIRNSHGMLAVVERTYVLTMYVRRMPMFVWQPRLHSVIFLWFVLFKFNCCRCVSTCLSPLPFHWLCLQLLRQFEHPLQVHILIFLHFTKIY